MQKSLTSPPERPFSHYIQNGRCYGMEMNVEKNKINENFKTTIASKNNDRPKTTRQYGIF
jgi:hypothetical protein